MRYPNSEEEIGDPSPRLPPDLAKKIQPLVPRAALAFRRAVQNQERVPERVLTDLAEEIFGTIAPRRLHEHHTDIAAFRESLQEEIDTTLGYIFNTYKQAGYGRMEFVLHRAIQKQLWSLNLTNELETKWLEQQADAVPTMPIKPPPVPTRAPRTDTAARIEDFMHKVEKGTGERIQKKDIWRVARYSSDKEFRAFQAENPRLSEGIITRFNNVLKVTPQDFIQRRNQMRAKFSAQHSE